VLGLAVAALAGCGIEDASATTGPDDAGLGTLLDTSVVPTLDGNFPDAAPDAPLQNDGGFCQGSGPVITIPGAGTLCTGDIGPTTFLFAVCSCTDVNVSGALRTDSLVPGSTTTGSGGSVGTNGSLTTNSSLDVSGSVWSSAAGGSPAVHIIQSGGITGDVHAGGSVEADAPLTIGGNLWANGDAIGTITCGTAFLPPGAATGSLTAAGGIVRQAVSVAPPCDCTDLLDVNTIVGSFAASNDDPGAMLGPTSLSPFPSSTVVVPCGRYYFQGIDSAAPISMEIQGRAAIFVQGDFHAGDTLTLTLDPGAELDLFITGKLLLDKDANLGDTVSPARVRVYVGGDTLTLSGNAGIGANIYAPLADVQLASDFSMAGSLFVGSLTLSGTFTIHYDESILSTAGCSSGGNGCTSCHQCSGATPACNGTICVPCVNDSDCCAPLHCSQGRCYDIIP